MPAKVVMTWFNMPVMAGCCDSTSSINVAIRSRICPVPGVVQILKLLLKIVNQAVDAILDRSSFWSEGAHSQRNRSRVL